MKVRLTSDGEANFVGIAREDTGHWFARVQFNGELSVEDQERYAECMIDGINNLVAIRKEHDELKDALEEIATKVILGFETVVSRKSVNELQAIAVRALME